MWLVKWKRFHSCIIFDKKYDKAIQIVFNDTGVEYPETYRFVDFLEKAPEFN